MKYIVAGYNMITDIFYADGTSLENVAGGSFYSASGVKFWRDNLTYIGTAGPDFDSFYGKWFQENEIECKVNKCLPKTLKYTLSYGNNGIWSEKCSYGEEYESLAKDKGRITCDMFKNVLTSPDEKVGIYIEASLSAKIADDFKMLKKEMPCSYLMWEINGDDLRDPSLKDKIEERIALVDAFSMNLDEATSFFQTSEFEKIVEKLKKYGKPCFLRLGEKGSGIVSKDDTVFGPSVGVEESVDPTGCGNCSTAACLIGLAEGLENKETVSMANIAAAYCARQNGPWPKVTEEIREKATSELKEYLETAEFF